MYDESNVPPPEYRVRLVARYVVTRYCHPYRQEISNADGSQTESLVVRGGSEVVCEVPNEDDAYQIAKALAEAEGATVQRD